MPETRPAIRDLGLTGILVTFSDSFSDAANRAALAFRSAVEAESLEGIEETSTSLASVYVQFDPTRIPGGRLKDRLSGLLADKDWSSAALPAGRRLWTIPVVLGGEQGPQFADAASVAGLGIDEARSQISAARLRVLTVGFAPGQPYMGELPASWDIPRLAELTPRVPGGALVAAIRQLIIFAGPTPTGWRHIGQTAFRCFRPESDSPFALTPGDEVGFRLIEAGELDDIASADETGDGGATWDEII